MKPEINKIAPINKEDDAKLRSSDILLSFPLLCDAITNIPKTPNNIQEIKQINVITIRTVHSGFLNTFPIKVPDITTVLELNVVKCLNNSKNNLQLSISE